MTGVAPQIPPQLEGLYTTDDIDSRMLYKEFQEGVDIYNQAEPAVVNRFMRKSVKESVRVWQRNMAFVIASEGFQADWQKGRAMEISLALDKFALGLAYTKEMIQDETADEIKQSQKGALAADKNLLMRRFIYQATRKGSGAVSSGWWDGNMSAASLRAPPPYKGNTFTTGHNHFDVSGSPDMQLSYFSAMKKEIREHGYKGPLWMFMHSDQIEQMENLAGWDKAATPTDIQQTVATKGFEAVKLFQGFTIIHEDWIPSGYMMAIEGKVKPMTMREPLNAKGRGLKLWKGPYEDYPLSEAYYDRRFDMTVVHRGAGTVLQITANATYTNPTFSFR